MSWATAGQNTGMAIHQIQVLYDTTADRLLVHMRTATAEVYSVWLTRRMLSRLYGPFRRVVTLINIAKTTPQALAVPEAREMLEKAALERPLANADFGKPFVSNDASYPLGPEPLLPDAVDLRQDKGGQTVMVFREPRGRRIEVALSHELSAALLRLIDSALATAQWDLPASGTEAEKSAPAEATGDAPAPGRLLN
jgi:hypothetical protein